MLFTHFFPSCKSSQIVILISYSSLVSSKDPFDSWCFPKTSFLCIHVWTQSLLLHHQQLKQDLVLMFFAVSVADMPFRPSENFQYKFKFHSISSAFNRLLEVTPLSANSTADPLVSITSGKPWIVSRRSPQMYTQGQSSCKVLVFDQWSHTGSKISDINFSEGHHWHSQSLTRIHYRS
jgi:hypothetical protein